MEDFQLLCVGIRESNTNKITSIHKLPRLVGRIKHADIFSKPLKTILKKKKILQTSQIVLTFNSRGKFKEWKPGESIYWLSSLYIKFLCFLLSTFVFLSKFSTSLSFYSWLLSLCSSFLQNLLGIYVIFQNDGNGKYFY